MWVDDLVQMLNHSIIWSLVIAWLVSPTPGVAEQPADKYVKLELVSEQGAIVPGKDLWLGFRFDLQDEWHTYWINPGDSGEAPRIEWQLVISSRCDSVAVP